MPSGMALVATTASETDFSRGECFVLLASRQRIQKPTRHKVWDEKRSRCLAVVRASRLTPAQQTNRGGSCLVRSSVRFETGTPDRHRQARSWSAPPQSCQRASEIHGGAFHRGLIMARASSVTVLNAALMEDNRFVCANNKTFSIADGFHDQRKLKIAHCSPPNTASAARAR